MHLVSFKSVFIIAVLLSHIHTYIGNKKLDNIPKYVEKIKIT